MEHWNQTQNIGAMRIIILKYKVFKNQIVQIQKIENNTHFSEEQKEVATHSLSFVRHSSFRPIHTNSLL